MKDIKELLNNKIIVCFKEDKNIFLNLKKENPFLNFKIIDVREIYERLSFLYDYKALVEIIHRKKVSLSAAKQIIECLRFIDTDNDFDNLLSLKNELIETGIIVKKDYQKIILQRSQILLFNQQNNGELQHILNKNNIKYAHLAPSELGINFVKNFELIKYKNRFEQFNDICNQICTLISSGVDPNEIAIRANYNDASFYFNIFEDLYNLKFYFKKNIDLRIYKSVQNLLSSIYENKSFDVTFDECDEYHLKVKTYIEQFRLHEIEFERAYGLLLEILDTYKETLISKSGILVTNDFSCSSRQYTFEMEFDFDNYPTVFSDNGYYNDQQLEKIGMNPSYIKTQIDNDKKRLFLFYSNVILTVTSLKMSSEVFMSTYVEELKINIVDFIKVKIMNNSFNATKLIYKYHKNNYKNGENAAKLNNFYNRAINIEENYNYKFKNFIDSSYSLTRSSYSALNNYYVCPFKFYCEKVLGISTDIKTSAIDLGNFTHKVLEKVFDKDFDFEESFNNAINDKKNKFDESTKLFFNHVVKDYVKVIASFLIERYNEGNYIEHFSERKMTYEVGNTEFLGFIDSVLVSEMNGFKYLTIVDYKTGSAKFDPVQAEYGLTLQLPIYSLFASKDKELESYKIGGLFIQSLFSVSNFESENHLNENSIKFGLKLSGIYEADPDYICSIEKNATDKVEKSKFISSKPSHEDMISEMKEVAEEKVVEFVSKVNDFQFEILPYKFSTSDKLDGCEYCSFRNICYRNGKDYRIVEKTSMKGAKNEAE